MKVLAVPHKALFEMAIHVADGTTIEMVVKNAREEGVTLCAWARETPTSYTFRVVGLKVERPLWERAFEVTAVAHNLAMSVWVMAFYTEPVRSVYGETMLVPSELQREAEMVLWVERVSLPTGDLATGDREDELFTVSHVNPLGGTESEAVRADGHVAAAEKYASYVCDLYGESHFIHREGHLAMRVVDSKGAAHRIEMGRDLSMRDHTIES